jgi:hypothetical protein
MKRMKKNNKKKRIKIMNNEYEKTFGIGTNPFKIGKDGSRER